MIPEKKKKVSEKNVLSVLEELENNINLPAFEWF